MKKNVMMRIASVLMIAVLLTTCVISGTFAKYTSTATASDTVTIAKWNIELDGEDMSSATNSFNFDLFTTINDTADHQDEEDVRANMIAPGTEGSFSIELTNTSDVNATYSVTFEKSAENATATEGDPTAADIPIEFSVDGVNNWAIDIGELDFSGVLLFEDNDTEDALDPTTATITVYWRWAFTDNVENQYGTVAAGDLVITANVTVTQVN